VTPWEDIKKYHGKRIGAMCYSRVAWDRIFEVRVVMRNSIAYHSKQLPTGLVKPINCIILSELDFKIKVPENGHMDEWTKDCHYDIKKMRSPQLNK
jgi:hypothetical protein